jgi:hypothetical protein
MRFSFALTVMLVCSALLAADDKDKDKDKPTVKEIATKDLKLNLARGGKATEPTTISSTEELAKNPTVKDAAHDIKKQIDFEKEKLIVFAWSGSGGDKVTASIGADSNKKPIVYVEYIRGLTRDLRMHVRLFIVPKDLKVEVDITK